MPRGEEKQFEVTIDRLIEYAKNIKISLVYFIQRIETEGDNLEWPQVLDSFTSICGQINTLMRYTRENKLQYIESRVVLPLLLSPDRDEQLAKLTEGRVHLVNHEMVPDYLRTKPDPEIEKLENSIQSKCSTISPDAAGKLINGMTKLVDTTINTIKFHSARTDSEMSRQAKTSFSNNDTNELLAATVMGRGLKSTMHVKPTMPIEQIPQPMAVRNPRDQVKAPELKTNIKLG